MPKQPDKDAPLPEVAPSGDSTSPRRTVFGTMGIKTIIVASCVLIVFVVVAVTLWITLSNDFMDNESATSPTVNPSLEPRQSATLEIQLEGILPDEYQKDAENHTIAFESACADFFSDELQTNGLRNVQCKVLAHERQLSVPDLFTYVIVRFAVSGIGENPLENYNNLLRSIMESGGPNFAERLRQVTTLFRDLEAVHVVDEESQGSQNTPAPTSRDEEPQGSQTTPAPTSRDEEPQGSQTTPAPTSRDEEPLEPQTTPAPTNRDEGVTHFISQRVGESLLASDGPHKDALDWILTTDPRQLDISSPNLFQRYASAYFYFSTGPWSECGPPSEPDGNATCLITKFVVEGHQDPYLKAMSMSEDVANRWLSSEPECEWKGVTCNTSEQIRKIELEELGFQGVFPFSLHFFEHLEELSLRSGQIVGPLPGESFAKLQKLVSLDLEYQNIGGSVADAWEACKTIKTVNLDSNNLSGPFEIPDTESSIESFSARWNALGEFSSNIGRAPNLKVLNLGGNGFSTTTIPEAMYTWSALEELYLDENPLMGSISSSISDMTNLRILDLHHEVSSTYPWESPPEDSRLWSNRLSGSLPPEFPKGLEVLNLEGNLLNGTLPDFPTNIHRLQLNKNDFAGTIPESLYELRTLTSLNLADNLFTGTISSKIGQLTDLYYLRFSRNALTGTIPNTTNQLVALRSADFTENDLSGFLSIPQCFAEKVGAWGYSLGADCHPDTSTPDNYTKVECPCCTWCCIPSADWCIGDAIDNHPGMSCRSDAIDQVGCIGG